LHRATCGGRRIAVWGLICVTAALGLAVPSCGGTTSPPQTKHYSNASYNFAFDYKAPLGVTQFGSAPAGYEFAYGVSQGTSQSDYDKGIANWLIVAVGPGSGSHDPRLLGTVWFRTQTKDAQALDSFSLIARKQTNLAGQPAFLFEGTGWRSGKALHFKNLYVVTPTYAYQLVAQAGADVWNAAVGQQVQRALSSFRFLHSPPAAPVGGQASPATVAFRNSAFRFSFRYPASFSKMSQDENPNWSAADFAVGFLDAGAAEGGQSGTLDGVLVQVMRLPKKLTVSQAGYVLRSVRAAQEKQTKAQYESMHPGAKVSAIRVGRFNGTLCYIYEASYPYNGGQQHEKTYYLMVGRFAYQIQLSSPQTDWSANRGRLERVARSFRTF
jgi:hypothetical protein